MASGERGKSDFGKELYWAAISLLGGLATGAQVGAKLVEPVANLAIPIMLLLLVSGLTFSYVRSYRRRFTSRKWSLERDGNPYPANLEPFSENYAPVLYGRDREIERIATRVRKDSAVSRRFVPLVGPSGCGKSSLVRAGLLPELIGKRSGLRSFSHPRMAVVGPFTPGESPIAALAQALGRASAVQAATATPTAGARANLGRVGLGRLGLGRVVMVGRRRSQALGGGLDLVEPLTEEANAAVEAFDRGVKLPSPTQLLAAVHGCRGDHGRLVLVIDHLEEVVVDATIHERRMFMALLHAALLNDKQLVIIGVLRSDYSGRLQEGPGSDLFATPEGIGAMSPLQLRAVINGPAAATGTTLAAGLVDLMIDDARGADALPLLSFVLHQLYKRAALDGLLTIAEYEQAMGVENAISRHADDVVDDVTERMFIDVPRDVARGRVFDVLLEAVNVDGSESGRRRFGIDHLAPEGRAVVNAFVRARILTVGQGPDGVPSYEIAHEVLLRRWKALSDAIDANREALQLRTRLEPRAREWLAAGRDPSYLLRGTELHRVDEFVLLRGGTLGELIFASINNLTDEAERRADQAAEQAMLALAPPRFVRDQELAVAIALAAAKELRPTMRVRFALYQAWWAGLRGIGRGHTGPVFALAWSGEGKLASASYDRTVRIWSADGALVRVLKEHAGPVTALAWSGERRLASASQDRTVRMWSTHRGVVRELSGYADVVTAVVWSDAGQRLVSASGDRDGTVRVRSADGGPVRTWAGHAGPVTALAWSVDGRLASASRDGTVRVWSADGETLGGLAGHSGPVTALAWSRKGQRLASACSDGSVRIWSGQGSLLHELGGHAGPVTAVAWSSQGRLASASYDRTVRIWSAEGVLVRELVGHGEPVTAVAWSAGGRRLASASGDREGTVRIWAVDGIPPTELAGHGGPVYAVAVSPDGTFVASASHDETIRVWMIDGRPLWTLTGHQDKVTTVVWSPDGLHLASVSADDAVRIWSADGRQVCEWTGHTDSVNAVAWSPNSQWLACADDMVRIRSTQGAVIHELSGHIDSVYAVAWSPDGNRLVSASHDGSVRIWSAEGVLIQELAEHEGAVTAVAWSPDGRSFATADNTVRIWSAEGAVVGELVGHTDGVYAVQWSPAGGLLVTASHDGSVRIWSAAGGSPHELAGHEGTVTAVAWSPDGSQLAAACRDGVVRIWSADATLVHELAGHTDAVTAVAWSPDGQTLVSASRDATVRIWPVPLPLDALMDLADGIRGLRVLTPEERRRSSLPPQSG